MGWTFQEVDMGHRGIYRLIHKPGGAPTGEGGMMHMEGPMWDGIAPHWMTYLHTDDIDAALARVPDLGGKIHVPATPIPNVGRFAVVADPAGAIFSLLEPPKG